MTGRVMGALRRRSTVVSGGLAGAALGLVVSARPIATGVPAAGSLAANTRLAATGSDLAPGYVAMLLVAAAAAVALAFAGTRLRLLIAGLLVASGVGAELSWRAGVAAAAEGLSRATVPAGLAVSDVAVAPVAALGDVAAVLVALAGAAALILGTGWATSGSRYDAPGSAAAGAPRAAVRGGRPGTGGRDQRAQTPRTGPGNRSNRRGKGGNPAAAAGRGGGPPSGLWGQAGASGEPGRRTDGDWEALSRGEDPTA